MTYPIYHGLSESEVEHLYDQWSQEVANGLVSYLEERGIMDKLELDDQEADE